MKVTARSFGAGAYYEVVINTVHGELSEDLTEREVADLVDSLLYSSILTGKPRSEVITTLLEYGIITNEQILDYLEEW